MKKKFFQIAKKLNCQIENYESYRSDMGWQVFQMLVITTNGNRKMVDAGYIVGNSEDKNKMMPRFENEIKALSLA